MNYPIDSKYKRLFHAAVFTVIKCDFNPRIAELEVDSSDIRLSKIIRMIRESKYGMHDLSMIDLDKKTHLPRFNMPFELGIFIAAKYFDNCEHKKKNCLIFENKSHSYEKFISDIKGQDIESHNNDTKTIICKIRDWLDTNSNRDLLQGGDALWKEYQQFRRWLPQKCRSKKLVLSKLTTYNYAQLVYSWIEEKIN